MTQDTGYRPIPFHPLTILTPPIYQEPPSQKALLLIAAAVRRICADDTTYSVTFSPVVCPTDKRALYVLQPFFWKKEDGTWGACDVVLVVQFSCCGPRVILCQAYSEADEQNTGTDSETQVSEVLSCNASEAYV